MDGIDQDVIMLLTTSSCSNCPKAKEVYHKFFSEKDQEYVILDAHQNSELASMFGIKTVPTLLMIKNKKEFMRINGIPTKDKLEAIYNRYTGENDENL